MEPACLSHLEDLQPVVVHYPRSQLGQQSLLAQLLLQPHLGLGEKCLVSSKESSTTIPSSLQLPVQGPSASLILSDPATVVSAVPAGTTAQAQASEEALEEPLDYGDLEEIVPLSLQEKAASPAADPASLSGSQARLHICIYSRSICDSWLEQVRGSSSLPSLDWILLDLLSPVQKLLQSPLSHLHRPFLRLLLKRLLQNQLSHRPHQQTQLLPRSLIPSLLQSRNPGRPRGRRLPLRSLQRVTRLPQRVTSLPQLKRHLSGAQSLRRRGVSSPSRRFQLQIRLLWTRESQLCQLTLCQLALTLDRLSHLSKFRFGTCRSRLLSSLASLSEQYPACTFGQVIEHLYIIFLGSRIGVRPD